MIVQKSNEPVLSPGQMELDSQSGHEKGGSNETSSAQKGQSNIHPTDAKPEPIFLPHPAEDESASKRKWFEDFFFARICVQEFLNIAAKLREGDYTCCFGERNWGSYNVVVYITFSDGVEWVVKIPRAMPRDGEESKSLKSEYATLVFLQRIRSIHAPKVYGASFDSNNPAKTPYYIMDKVPGVPFWQAWGDNGISREVVFEVLRQLAEVRKTLARHARSEIGSLTMSGKHVVVERQVSGRNFLDGWEEMQFRPGPFDSSITYYANLLQDSWRTVQKRRATAEKAMHRWKIHAYPRTSNCKRASLLWRTQISARPTSSSTHRPDLLQESSTGNLHVLYHLKHRNISPFLLHKDAFLKQPEEVYNDPEAELNDWREFYAKQFEGDPAMEEYLQNIDAAIAFEDMLKDNELATIENLVEGCNFLESAETLEEIELPFPWKTPTKSPSPPLARESDSANTTRNEKLEMPAQTEQTFHNDSPTTNGGNDKTTLSPSSIIHTRRDKRPATTSNIEKAESAVQTEQISHDEFPTINDGDNKRTITLSQLPHIDHD